MIRKHFYRSLKIHDLYTSMGIHMPDIQININSNSINTKISSQNDRSLEQERFFEILSIEREKYNLKNKEKDIKNYFERDLKNFKKSELLLTIPIDDLNEIKLTINPRIKLYNSMWQWIVKKPYQTNFERIISATKDVHYFVLFQTGSFDVKEDTNIYEFAISDLHFYFLQLLETPMSVKSLVNTFLAEFEITSHEERLKFLSIGQHLIRELIYRMFAIQFE